ncbi:membrane-associated protein [Diaminobutyricimonas aerilata]|uniref:Membrane-associated protein n=1 Tax=Diaminobutyricimonas aerilata TaxID=1162967 RepID=A0A2M9CKA8_9MICO|nr:DedA family protein [Diaminobutyricimonas aerilata]PJJ72331.1 membrane-associated protein [Diaminobutyricimonas aerilata]
MPAVPTSAQTLGDQLAGMIADAGPVLFYLVVWGLVFCGTALFVGVVVPFLTGDSLLFAAGIVAATNDDVSIWVLCIGVAIAAIAGDQVGFVLGRRYGRPYLLRRRSRFVRAAVERTERLYELFGWWSVVVGRYVPWVRVFVAPVAGIGGMAYWRFVTANVVGAVTWGVLITAVGYWAATVPATRPIAYAVAGVVIAASVIAGVRAWRADRRARATEPDPVAD